MRFYSTVYIILRKFMFCGIILFVSAIFRTNLLRNFFCFYAMRKPVRFYGLFTALRLFSRPWRKARKPYPYIYTSSAKYTKYFLNPLKYPRRVDQTSLAMGVSVILSPPHHYTTKEEFLGLLVHLLHCRYNIFNAFDLCRYVFCWCECTELTRLLATMQT